MQNYLVQNAKIKKKGRKTPFRKEKHCLGKKKRCLGKKKRRKRKDNIVFQYRPLIRI